MIKNGAAIHNRAQLQVGAPVDGVSVNATVQFSRIITFRETKGLLGGLGLAVVRAISLTDSGALL